MAGQQINTEFRRIDVGLFLNKSLFHIVLRFELLIFFSLVLDGTLGVWVLNPLTQGAVALFCSQLGEAARAYSR